MLFSSPVFVFLFLPAVLLAYALVSAATRGGSLRARNLALLVPSLAFYAWGEGRLVLLMLASIAGNWLLGLLVDRRRRRAPQDPRAGLCVVALAVVFDLGLLAWFKYANFAVENLRALGLWSGGWEQVVLPIGVSFFTFQALSYVVDVYRGDGPVQRSPLDFGLYVALFPQLIAGPIVRYRDVALQLLEREASVDGFVEGVRRFVIGLGKKVLVANPLAFVADRVFDAPPHGLSPAVAWLGALAYALQIYFDFSGYSDMAIGLGRMFGFRFLENFRWPYVARSVTDFWRRWHVSLSTWFRDYLYVPLGGNRRGRARTLANLLVVFLLCGLWHGASWSFVVWGLYHGAFLIAERLVGPRRAPAALRHAYLLAVVVVGWVFFRATDLPRAAGVLRAMAGLQAGDGRLTLAMLLDPLHALALAAGIVGATPWAESLRGWRERAAGGAGRLASGALEWAGAAALFLVLLGAAMALAAQTYNPFIYFRF